MGCDDKYSRTPGASGGSRCEPLFHTGWFVESLATQTPVLFVIRTMGNPFRSRPSRALAFTTVLMVAIGAILPATPHPR
jgi:Mg2+-importing ATPase